MGYQSNSKKDLPIISGIQQIGIGVCDAKEAWKWSRRYFGMYAKIARNQ